MEDVVNLMVNSGTTIVVLAYFLWRDYQFTRRLDTSLELLKTQTHSIETLLQERMDE